jgi:hypothetical protein
MNARRVTFASWVVCVVATLAALVFLAMGIGASTPGDDFVIGGWGGLAFAFAALAFGTVGALVSNRLPDNRVGWIFCGIGAAIAVGDLGYQYGDQALFGSATGLPAGDVAVWSQNLTVPPCFGLIAVALMLFPDGHLPSPRWRAAVVIALTGSAFESIGYALRPGHLDAPFETVVNPMGVDGAFDLFEVMSSIGWPFMGLGLVLAAAAMRRRSKRATGLERQQLKWVAFAAAVAGVLIAIDIVSFFVASHETDLNLLRTVTLGVAFSVIPVAAGVAILRYRLYDIDVVINRTLVYGALTATLAAVYLGSILLLQLVLRTITEGSGLAVAASTLATAALVRPARARIQAIVDHRFYRRKYDAGRTLDDFGTRLRDEIDLETLQSDLRSVVAETMQPAHVTLWLRAQEKRQIVTLSGRSTRRQESS